MRKFTAFILSVLMVLSLGGCSQGTENTMINSENEADAGPVTTATVPGDGIIVKDLFENAKKSGNVLYIKGNDGNYDYQWAVFGNRLNETADRNMKISVSKEEENKYSIKTSESFDFRPSLSVSLPGETDVIDAVIYDKDGNALGSATLSGYKDHSDICFYAKDDVTEYSVTLIKNNGGNAESKQEETVASNDNKVSTNSKTGGNAVIGGSDYLSSVGGSGNSSGQKVSDGTQSGKDQYNTDPVPEGKPLPVEPEDQKETGNVFQCTISISCATILNNMDLCDPEKKELVPSDGWILKTVTVSFNEGENVFDILQKVTRENKIHMESTFTPLYNSVYVEGINNLYEFDVGELSGWMYSVNGWFPNYGASRYLVQNGDVIRWVYTCDLGYDVGGGYAVGG